MCQSGQWNDSQFVYTGIRDYHKLSQKFCPAAMCIQVLCSIDQVKVDVSYKLDQNFHFCVRKI